MGWDGRGQGGLLFRCAQEALRGGFGGILGGIFKQENMIRFSNNIIRLSGLYSIHLIID